MPAARANKFNPNNIIWAYKKKALLQGFANGDKPYDLLTMGIYDKYHKVMLTWQEHLMHCNDGAGAPCAICQEENPPRKVLWIKDQTPDAEQLKKIRADPKQSWYCD